MIIAITSKGDSLQSAVDPRFGRARRFVLYSTDDDTTTVIDNIQNAAATQGAGIQAAQTIADRNVDALITGHCGPKAFRTLEAAGIKVFTNASGTVANALAQYKKGELDAAAEADVDGHWR